MTEGATRKAIAAIWRIESARVIGGLVRMVRNVELAEDLAQEALVTALARWPDTGLLAIATEPGEVDAILRGMPPRSRAPPRAHPDPLELDLSAA